jgi:hypothetical protein
LVYTKRSFIVSCFAEHLIAPHAANPVVSTGSARCFVKLL